MHPSKPVAVLISVYHKDNPSWFARALDSVLNQRYDPRNIRVYLGIDGPISAELSRVIAGKRKQLHEIVYSDENRGLAASLNRLIARLKEENYVFRADSDDICLPDRFARQIAFMEQNRGVDICGTGIIEMDEYGHELGRRTYPAAHHEIVNNFHKGSPLAHATVCFRREALDRLERYNASLRTCQDIEMWFRGSKAGLTFANIGEPLYRVRTTDGFYARRTSSKAAGELKIYWRGCVNHFGYNWRLLFPIFRFFSRLPPPGVVRMLYKSGLRQWILR